MKHPLYVRTFTAEERAEVESGLRCSDAFTLRRAQIVLSSSRGQTAQQVAPALGCAEQTVRNVIRAFNAHGSLCLRKQSCRPKTCEPLLDQAKREHLHHILHQSPRQFGQPRSVWTQPLLAKVCCQEGLTEQVVSDETIRRALR